MRGGIAVGANPLTFIFKRLKIVEEIVTPKAPLNGDWSAFKGKNFIIYCDDSDSGIDFLCHLRSKFIDYRPFFIYITFKKFQFLPPGTKVLTPPINLYDFLNMDINGPTNVKGQGNSPPPGPT